MKFQNVNCMSSEVFRINEDAAQIYHYIDDQQVLEDVAHKVLEGGRSISEVVMYDKKFVGAVLRAKGGLPFVLLRLSGPSCKRGEGPSW